MDTSVLIVGGGPCGLALAGALGRRGVDCIVVEKQSASAPKHPTANHLSVRTLEHLRRWGLADRVRHETFPADYGDDRVFLARVRGHELVRFVRPANGDPQRPAYSPESEVWCPKPYFHPVLEEHAASLPSVRLEYGRELDSFVQDDAGVRATLRSVDSGRRHEIRAAYLAACDGAASPVRERLGIARVGRFSRERNIHSTFFRSRALRNLLPPRATQYWFVGGVGGTLVAIDGQELWRAHFGGDLELTGWLRALGAADVDVEVRSQIPWGLGMGIARELRRGRVFLVGDAAHVVTPYGGLGMNTGLGDAVDLGWKLAGTLEGWGGPGLIESYAIERRQAALAVLRYQGLDVSGAEPRELGRRVFALPERPPELEEDSVAGERARRSFGADLRALRDAEFNNAGVDLGDRCEDSPICVAEAGTAPPAEIARYTQTARPGGRAPHAWLADGRSTLDLLGRGFTLLRLEPGADAGLPGLREAARRRGLPLDVVQLAEADLAELYSRPNVLVRPDGIVAWRSDEMPRDPDALIDRVRGASPE